MPQIREYDLRQEVKAGVGDTSRTTPDDFGASTGRSLEQVGRSVNQLGNQLQRQQEQDEINEITTAMASAQAEATVQLDDQITRGTVDSEKFIDGLDQKFGDLSGNYSTRAAQEYFNQSTGKLKNHFIVSAARASSEQAGNKAKASFVVASNKQQAALMNDPSAFQLSLQTMEDGLNARVATGSLAAADAEKLKIATSREYAKSAIRGWSKLNPEDAKAQINEGLWDDYLDGDSKKQMMGEAEMGVNARLVEQERTKAAAEKARVEAERKTMNDLFPAIARNELPADKIIDNPNLDAVTKNQMLGWSKEYATNSETMRTNPKVFNELFARIHLPPGDPRKITDEKQLNPIVGKGLDLDGLNKLRNEIQGDNTEEGKARSALKASMLNSARSKLVKKDAWGNTDFNGEENYQRFLLQQEADYQAGKAKGLTDQELFNPDSKDYIGKSINSFYKTPQQRMQETAARQKQEAMENKARKAAVQSNPELKRKDGETLADYRKRTSSLTTKEPAQ